MAVLSLDVCACCDTLCAAFSYGDWIPPTPYGQTDGHLIASYAFMKDVQTILRMATVLNDTATVKDYTALYAQLTVDFNSAFYHSPTLGYADGSQAANTLALALPGVVNQANLSSVLGALIANLTQLGHHTCGIVSVSQLFPVLSTHGYHDVALSLAQQTSYPSYGYMFTNAYENATTLWERWDSALQSPYSNSRNHIMYGSIGAWFYRYVAGIDLNGLSPILIGPRHSYDATLMRTLHAEVVTVRGSVSVDYERQGDGSEIVMAVTVPLNTEAVVVMEPLVKGGACQTIRESGRVVYETGHLGGVDEEADIQQAEREVGGVGRVTVDEETGAVSLQVQGGRYQFIATWE